MTIALSALLPALAAASGVRLEDVLSPLRDAFWQDRGMPRYFRSHLECAGGAVGLQSNGRVVTMPDGLPYIAGVACGDNIRLTGVRLGEGAMWYGEMNEAKLFLRGIALPTGILAGCRGRRVAEMVDHPAFATLDDEIIAASENDGHVTFRVTQSTVLVDDPLDRPTPRTDWIRQFP